MPTLTVRQLDEAVYAGLKDVADRAGRSMEAEARRILEEAVRSRTWWDRWVAATEPLRGEDLPIPPPSLPREVDLT